MNSNPQPDDDAELDRLLANATWPDPDDQRLARLTDHWRAARRARARGIAVACALAAGLLLAIGIVPWRSPPAVVRPASIARAKATATSPAPPRAPPPRSPAVNSREAKAGGSIGRDPTLYERVVMWSASARRLPAERTTNRRKMLEASVQEMVDMLAAEPAVDVDDRLPVGQAEIGLCQRLVAQILSHARGTRRLAATRLLAKIATTQSLPILIGLANDPETRAAALPGIARLAGTQDLTQMANAEVDADLRGALLTMLLERRTPEAVAFYLGFVGNPDTRGSALEAVAQMSDPPLDVLFAFVQSPQRSLRLAAACALARRPEPEVVRRLSRLALEPIGRQEALIALLLSQSSQANRFLDHARQDLYLTALVHAAEQELHSLTAPAGGNLR